MIMGNPLPFVEAYVEQLGARLASHQPKARLSPGQKAWLSFCLMGIIVTESVCWKKFVRAGLGQYSEALLSWYFRGPMPWDLLLVLSVRLWLDSVGTWEGVLVLDDTGKRRAKVTTRIPHVHYVKDKPGTGTMRGQEVVFLVLVTPVVTILVGFAFYPPDPAYSAWAKADKRLKRQGVSKSKRPAPPPDNPAYPSKPQLAVGLLEQFAHDHPRVKGKAILADALDGNAVFMAQAAKPWGERQVISQLRHNQKEHYRGRSWRLDAYFRAYPGVPQTICVRGGERIEVWVSSARRYVEAHGCKRFVVAIRYPDQRDYRYLVASELSWRTLDIVQAHTGRWLVEVAIEDLKVYEGWGQATKQPGDAGSSRGLALSLLCDHCLLLHPDQQARVDQRQPVSTIGSLQRRLQMDALVAWLQEWLDGDAFADKLDQLTQAIRPLFPLQPSKKHLHLRDWGRLEPTASLKYRAQHAQAKA
jgi:hypothetical protein